MVSDNQNLQQHFSVQFDLTPNTEEKKMYVFTRFLAQCAQFPA